MRLYNGACICVCDCLNEISEGILSDILIPSTKPTHPKHILTFPRTVSSLPITSHTTMII